MIQKLETLIDR